MNAPNKSSPYSARHSPRPTHFFCQAPGAKCVQIVGDFNQWTPVGMERGFDGWWHCEILLCHGHHQYRFLVDGKALLDPAAMGKSRDSKGDPVSLIAVS